jgi:hypothetical protein
MLGAFLVALVLHANLVAWGKSLSAIMVICMIAGVSERLVPSFIEQIESRVTAQGPKSSS